MYTYIHNINNIHIRSESLVHIWLHSNKRMNWVNFNSPALDFKWQTAYWYIQNPIDRQVGKFERLVFNSGRPTDVLYTP